MPSVTRVLDRAAERIRTWWTGQGPLPIWYHEHYRLPIAHIHEAMGIEPRRADLALWALLGTGRGRDLAVHEAPRVAYGDLALVHTPAYLESLTRPDTLAAVFGLPDGVPVDPVVATFRTATGGTVAATRHVLAEGGPALNLLGGFHHAHRDRGGGLSPVNDIAVAVAVARGEGFTGQVVVLDLDAHPPDGLADTLGDDPKVWIGSLSGSDWGPLEGVDETVLEGADDITYLRRLDALLRRAPDPDLAFVIAGGDVLAEDRMGALALTLEGARRRDTAVFRWLGHRPSVWVPGGGYQDAAWRVLAHTAQVLSGDDGPMLAHDLDPVAAHFAYVSRSLDPVDLTGVEDDTWFTQEEVDAMFGAPVATRRTRLLDHYTVEGIEYALYAFGFLTQLRRLGYGHFRVAVERTPTGDRATLHGEARGEHHLLWEMVVAVESLQGHRFLLLNWMQMRHPLGTWAPGRPKLPGQDVPGLGMAEEAMHLVWRMCERLELDGVLLRPAWYHTAWMGRTRFRFLDPAAQGRFEALQRDLGHIALPRLTAALADGQVRMGDAPWRWEAEPMVSWRVPHEEDADAVAAARATARFSLPAS